jgi:DivIVA domain-containing protein
VSAIVFVIGLLLVGGLLFLGASVLLGRGETQPPAELDRSPVELPEDRPVVGDDVRALRLSVTARGYRMTEVDWLLEQFATALDERDAELGSLRAQLDRPAPLSSSATTPAVSGAGATAAGSADASTPESPEEQPRA